MTDLNRVIIDASVDRALRNISREPRRTLRNLLDLGLLFAKTPMQKKYLQTVAEMLANDDSAYFDLAARVMRQMDREWLKNVCVNVGYEACIVGARAISQAEEQENMYIPWSIRMCCGEEGLSPVSMEEIVWQSVQLGIHIFLLDDEGIDPESLRELMEQYPKCTFFVMTQPERLRHWDLSEMGLCRNLALLLDYDAPGVEEFQQRLLDNRCVYGMYRCYNDDNAQEVVTEEALRDYTARQTLVFVLSAAGDTSESARTMVRGVTETVRRGQRYPLILLDADGDISDVERVISQRSFVLRFDGQGDAHAMDWPREVPVANIHSIPLREILRQAAPRVKKEGANG